MLYNGACNADTSFEISFGGADMGGIALLGSAADFPIENVTASAAFNFAARAGGNSKFQKTVKAKSDTTYAFLRLQSPAGSPGAVRTLFAVQTGEGCENAASTCNFK